MKTGEADFDMPIPILAGKLFGKLFERLVEVSLAAMNGVEMDGTGVRSLPKQERS